MKLRPYEQIIAEAAGGATPAIFAAFAEQIGASAHQPRDWYGRKSIPPEWWGALIERGLTTFEELQHAAVVAADRRKAGIEERRRKRDADRAHGAAA